MKKVLLIIGALYVGGAERVARDIGFHADKSQYEIDYLVFGDTVGAYEQELQDAGCRIYHFAAPGENHVRYYRNLLSLLRERQYDVVHSHTMFNSGLNLLAAHQAGVPVRIAHSHSIRGPEKRGFIKNSYENTMRRWILRHATHLVACGQSAGEWLYGTEAFQKRGILIYNGIDLDAFAFRKEARRRIRQQYGLENAFVIGHVGHLAPVKNQKFLIGILPQILVQQPTAVLLLLGEGEDRAMLEETIRQTGLQERVIMTGNVRNVPDYLCAMDVFAFPSLYEGMPLSVIEVQANGLPCILSDRVPKDVDLTDLVQRLPLDSAADWQQAILCAQRNHPEAYHTILQENGFDTNGMLQKVFAIYERDCL